MLPAIFFIIAATNIMVSMEVTGWLLPETNLYAASMIHPGTNMLVPSWKELARRDMIVSLIFFAQEAKVLLFFF